MTRFSNKLLLPSLYHRSLPILNRWRETYWNAHGYYQLEKVVKIIKYSLLASIFHQSILQVVSSFPLPLIEEPRSWYGKDDNLTGLHQCTLAENLKYSLSFLTKSISRDHQMRMSAKTMSTYTGFEPSTTKEMIEVREACPGECRQEGRASSMGLFLWVMKMSPGSDLPSAWGVQMTARCCSLESSQMFSALSNSGQLIGMTF